MLKEEIIRNPHCFTLTVPKQHLIEAAVCRPSSTQVILKIPQYAQGALKFLIQKRLQHSYFPVNIAKFLRTAFVIEHQWLFSTWPYYKL